MINLEYGAFRVAMTLIHIFPYRVFLFFVRRLSSLAYRILKDSRDAALESLLIAFPEKTKEEREYIAKESFKNVATTFAEFAYSSVWKNNKIERFIKIENLDTFNELLSRGKGLVVITGHIGNWEFMANIISVMGYNPAFIVRALDNQKLDNYIEHWRTKRGGSIINRNGDDLRNIFLALRANSPVGFLSDQNFIDGVFVPFFGKLAATASGAIAISMKTKSPIIIAYARRNKDYTHTLTFTDEFIIEERPTKNQTLLHNTARYTKMLEDIIRKNPTEWLWAHRRWATPPEHKPWAMRYDKIDEY